MGSLGRRENHQTSQNEREIGEYYEYRKACTIRNRRFDLGITQRELNQYYKPN